MKQTLKILLLRLLVLALVLGGVSVYLRTTAKESVTPLVKHFEKGPSPTWSKVWLTMYGYKITNTSNDTFLFDNGYWDGIYSNRDATFSHDDFFSDGNIEAEAGAVIGELKDLCGGYRPMGNGIVFSYGQKLVYVVLPQGPLKSVTVTLMPMPAASD